MGSSQSTEQTYDKPRDVAISQDSTQGGIHLIELHGLGSLGAFIMLIIAIIIAAIAACYCVRRANKKRKQMKAIQQRLVMAANGLGGADPYALTQPMMPMLPNLSSVPALPMPMPMMPMAPTQRHYANARFQQRQDFAPTAPPMPREENAPAGGFFQEA